MRSRNPRIGVCSDGMNGPLAALLCGAIALVATASERAIVDVTCPLDGTEFKAVQDFSGYAEGQRLDLKKLGPISQPRALARCPHCGFPLFTKTIGAADTERIRGIVAGDRFRTEARPATPWFALGVLREELKAEPFEIAWTYLQASWEAEEDGADAYARAAERALLWFDRAAEDFRDNTARSKDRHIALYLGVELSRRLGRFGQARERLQLIGQVRDGALPWLPRAQAAQSVLIEARNAAPDDGTEPALRPTR